MLYEGSQFGRDTEAVEPLCLHCRDSYKAMLKVYEMNVEDRNVRTVN